MDPTQTTKRRLTAGLAIAGAAGGAILGAALTVGGKIVAGAPPATPSNYLWNMAAFGLMGAFVDPVLAWSAMRRVPLWRTAVEPLAAGVGSAVVGMLLGSGAAFLVLPPLAIGAAVFRLARSHRPPLLIEHHLTIDSDP